MLITINGSNDTFKIYNDFDVAKLLLIFDYKDEVMDIELIEDSSASPKKDDSGPLSRSTSSISTAKLPHIFESHKFSQGLRRFGGVWVLL